MSVALLGGYGFFTTRETIRANIEEPLMGANARTAHHTEMILREIVGNVRVHAEGHLLRSLLAARDAGGIDPKYHDSYASWEARLAESFVATMRAYGRYAEMRYLDETGKEVVRVNKVRDHALVVPPAELQNKAERYYFKEAIALSAGEVYFSPIDLRRDFGRRVVPLQPMLRIAMPVFSTKGERRGLVIANVVPQPLVHPDLLMHPGRGQSAFIADAEGYYVHHTDVKKEFGGPGDLNTGENVRRDYPDLADQILSGKRGREYGRTGDVIFYQPILSPGTPRRLWILGRVFRVRALFAPVRRWETVGAGVALLTFAFTWFVGVAVSRRLIQPLRDLANAVGELERGNLTARVVSEATHEVGALAKSFNNMAAHLQESYAVLEWGEARLSNAQRIAHLGNWDWNIVENTLYWSDEVYRIFGLEPHQFGATCEAFLATVHPDDVEFVKASVKAALEERKPYSIDHRIVLPDGSVRTVHEQSEVTFDATGRPVRMAGTVQDITERKQAEEALQASLRETRLTESKFRGILESAPDGIVIVDQKGHIALVNAQAEALFGYDRGELLGKPVEVLVPKRSRARHAQQCRGYRSSPQQRPMGNALELTGLRKDGSEFPAEISLSPVYTEEGLFVMDVVRDLTDRKQAEVELRKLSRVIEQTADSVVVTNREGIIEYVNPAFEAISGYSAEETLGNTPRVIKSGRHEPEFYQKLWETIAAGEVFRDTIINKKKNEELYYDEKTITPLRDDRGNVTHYVATGKDITDRVLAQQELERRNQELSALHQISSAFTTTLELGEILTALLDNVVVLTGASRGTVMLVDNRTGGLEVAASRDAQGPVPATISLARGEGAAGWVAEHGEALHIPEVARDERYLQVTGDREPASAGESNVQIHDQDSAIANQKSEIKKTFCYLGLPLIVEGRIIGVLNLTSDVQHECSTEEMSFLQSLCVTAAVALQNALLYQEIGSRAKELAGEMAIQKQYAENVVRSIADAVYTVDARNYIVSWNPSAEAITGYTAEEVVGRPCAQFQWNTDETGRVLCFTEDCPFEVIQRTRQP
ncbi:MAG: PAS domain S-box protein, partial [Armatimonadetes bacterium]|nr:PAS domain S-box protein [Armatimonadota bacterium]